MAVHCQSNLSHCHHREMHQIEFRCPSAEVYNRAIRFSFICSGKIVAERNTNTHAQNIAVKMQASQLLLIAIALISIKLSTASHVKTALDNELIKFKASIADGLKLPKMEQAACTCAVFLSGQFKKGSPPTGNPALLHEHDTLFPCTAMGNKQCVNKCLESVPTTD